jgi:hypothetical protein
VTAEVVDQEPRDRHLAALVGLGRAPDHSEALDGRNGLGDDRTSPRQVDAVHAQRGHLTEPDPGVGEEQHDEPVHLVGALVVCSVLAHLARVAARVCERMRRLLRDTWGSSLSDQLRAETEHLHASGVSHDIAEAITAFGQKRRPQFEGR